MSMALEAFDRATADWRADPSERLGLDFSDLGNAERLEHAFARDLLFVVGRGWGVWTGARFDFDAGDVLAQGLAAHLRELVKAEADAASARPVDDLSAKRALDREGRAPPRGGPRFSELDGARAHLRAVARGELLDWAEKCGNRDKINAALEMLRSRLLVPLETLDADPWRLAASNGVIDLRAACAETPEAEEPEERAARRRAWLTPPDRALRNTRTLGVAFDPAATCPNFEAFIQKIQPDPAMRGYLQRVLGVTLFGQNFLQRAFLFQGSGGNGKSTLLNILAFVLGGYAASCKIEMFLAGRDERAGQATPEEVALPGARVMIATEPDATDTLSAKKIKSLTGGDPRPARALNMPQFIYRPTAVPILSFNRTPRIKGEDEGLWRRLDFVIFEVELHKLDVALRRDMGAVQAELQAEGPGILNWLLEGFASVKALGELAPPLAVSRLKEELRGVADPVGEFWRDMVIATPGADLARFMHRGAPDCFV